MSGNDYSGDAYRACLYGKADRNQQQSAASQIALLHGIKGELMTALRDLLDAHARNALYAGGGHWDAARSVIAKAEGATP